MSPKALEEQWVRRCNASDIEGLASLYAPDVVNHPLVVERLRGRAAIRRRVEGERGRAERVGRVENLFADGEGAILEWRDPEGLRGCGFIQVRDGEILFQRSYFDRLSCFGQLGLEVPEAYQGSWPTQRRGNVEAHADLDALRPPVQALSAPACAAAATRKEWSSPSPRQRS